MDRTVKIIEAEEVFKRYSQRRWWSTGPGTVQPALNSVSFTVRQGETVGLLGPNGAGKTTLLKILATLISVDAGSVRVFGHDVNRDPLPIRKRIGLVTCDERSFYWRLTGRRNLLFFATLYRVPSAAARDRIATLLETLGLTAAADRPYHSYSSGMRQKLAIARGLLASPDLVLYDEPTRSLDPLSSQNIRQWITENRARYPHTTNLIATNQLHEAERLCDRVIIVNQGEIIADGSIAEIRRRFEAKELMAHRILCRDFILAGGLGPSAAHGLISIVDEPGEEPGTTWLELRAVRDSEALSFVLGAILRSGGSVQQCQTRQIPLDEIFVSLIKAEQQASTTAVRA
jgi:ABC-2 type transport system ATP-binding protein